MSGIEQNNTRSARMPSIQILRAVAASVVVFHHFGEIYKEYHYGHSWIVSSGLSDLGTSGVDLFFVISGFIMVYTTIGKTGLGAAAMFVKKRFYRILPLYWFWSAVLLCLWAGGLALKAHHYALTYLVESFLLLPAYPGKYPFLQQGWTLSFEMLFYVLFAFAIALGLNRTKPLFLLGCFLALMLASQTMPADSGPKNFFSNAIMIEFLFGAVAAILVLRSKEQSIWRAPQFPAILIAAGSALLLGSLLLSSPESQRFIVYGIPSFLIVLGCGIQSPPLRESRIYKLLVYLGDASYSIYLIHELLPLFYATSLKRSRFLQGIAPDWTILVLGTATILLTSLGYPLIEQPIQRALARKRSPNRVPEVQAA